MLSHLGKWEQWSEKEIELLKEHYPNTLWDEFQQILPKRTKNAIYYKGRRIGLKREVPTSQTYRSEVRERISRSRTGYIMPEEVKEKIRRTTIEKGTMPPHYPSGKNHPMYGKPKSEEHKRKISEAHKGQRLSEETKKKIGRKSTELWRNEEFVKKVIKGLNAKPNKLEQRINIILQKNFPDQFRYNGDFSTGVVLNGMIPDFVNVNGKKQVIEVFGDLYHNEKEMKKRFNESLSWKRTEFGRKAAYSQLGWDCLILWEGDIKRMKEEEIVDEIKAFSEGGGVPC